MYLCARVVSLDRDLSKNVFFVQAESRAHEATLELANKEQQLDEMKELLRRAQVDREQLSAEVQALKVATKATLAQVKFIARSPTLCALLPLICFYLYITIGFLNKKETPTSHNAFPYFSFYLTSFSIYPY